MLRQNFETVYMLSQLRKVIGRRYNIRPDLDSDVVPEITGYVIKETTTGLFRAWKLNEMHLGITIEVNKLQVAERSQIIKKTGLGKKQCLSLIEECVVLGMLCENNIIFNNDESIMLYKVDTGGIFALEEAGIQYQQIKYTMGIDQELKIYRRNIFLVENAISEDKALNLHFLEDIVKLPLPQSHQGATLLVDLDIVEKMGEKEEVRRIFQTIAMGYNMKIYDLAARDWVKNY